MGNNYLEVTKELKLALKRYTNAGMRLSGYRSGINWSLEFYSELGRTTFQYDDDQKRLRMPSSGYFYLSNFKYSNLMILKVLPLGTKIKFDFCFNGFMRDNFTEGQIAENLYRTELTLKALNKNDDILLHRIVIDTEFTRKEFPTIKY